MDLANTPSECISLNDLRNLIGELRMIARRLLSREAHPHSFTPTALAMTALRRAKLEEQSWDEVRWENRAHFFAALSMAMNHAIVDHARRRLARGRNKVVYLPPDELLFHDLAGQAEECPDRILILKDALSRLEHDDKRLYNVIQQFYMLDYTTLEIAQLNRFSEKTVDRDLKKARILLRKLMESLTEPGAP